MKSLGTKEDLDMVENQENHEVNVLNVGDELNVSVLKLEEKQVVVDTGTKYDGVIPISELSHLHVDHTSEVLSEGEEVSVVVKKVEEDTIILSKKMKDREVAFQQLTERFENEDVFDVEVIESVNGGLVVNAGLSAFMPASHVETHYVEDLSAYKGKTLSVKIIEMDEEKNRIIVSHKAVAEKELEAKKQELLQDLEIGDIVEGTVQRLAPFGVFVDLGGMDGLVHISQLSHQHIDQPSDVVSEGDQLKVKVISVDRDNERIGLSVKETLPGPWDRIEDQINEGEIVEGNVVRLVHFGAFVEVLPGVEGLVHISQISKEHIGRPEEVLEEGQKVKAKVLEVNGEKKRISLSIREIEEDQDRSEYQKYQKDQDDHTFQLGDLVGDKLKKMRD